jgi:hypothetical protein
VTSAWIVTPATVNVRRMGGMGGSDVSVHGPRVTSVLIHTPGDVARFWRGEL